MTETTLPLDQARSAPRALQRSTPSALPRAFDSDRAAWQAIAVGLGWSAMVVAAHYTRTGPAGHRTALVLHLVSLAVGFGTVLAVDAYGLAVVFGRRSVPAMLRFAARADRFIWAGFAGLGVSGVYLDTELGSVVTIVNLWAVLIVGLNGVYARTVRDRLPALPAGAGIRDLPRPLLLRAFGSASLSQAAWWTSILIGTFAS